MFKWRRNRRRADTNNVRTPRQLLLVGCFFARRVVERVRQMFFRFAAALLLVVAVSMAQVALEKQSLRLRRAVSRQYYQMDELLELHAQLRLNIQQRTAPSQFVAESGLAAPVGTSEFERPESELSGRPSTAAQLPLLRWEQPVRPDGVSR